MLHQARALNCQRLLLNAPIYLFVLFILRIVDAKNQSRSVKMLPDTITELVECASPCAKPKSPVHPAFTLSPSRELPNSASLQDLSWLLARSLSSQENVRHETQEVVTENPNPDGREKEEKKGIPVWAAYNSLISNTMHVTKVGMPPLIAAPVHECPTLLTILMQAQKISSIVVGPDRKTVITLDMGLYQPAKKLQMARNDLHNLILRPGELHILITVLRTIGCYVEDSGLDTCWLEADIYGPATIKQILEGNHVKRGEAAHLVTLQALFALYQKAFIQSSQTDYEAIADLVAQVVDACSTETNEDLVEANMALMRAVDDLDVAQKMAEFDKKHEKIPLFKVMRQYMHMVTEMLQFTRAVRTGDWGLHLQALHSFTKYFFAHDRLNYSRMIPLYLAEMEELPRTDPEIYSEFLSGNWVVNKNQVVPLSAMQSPYVGRRF